MTPCIFNHENKIPHQKEGKKGSAFPIYIALYHNDETELIYTQARCALKDWSKEERCPKDHKSDAAACMEKVMQAILKVKRIMDANDIPVTPFTLKQEFLKTQKRKDDKQQEQDKKDKTNLTTVSSLIDRWIKEGLDNYQPSTRKVVITSIKQFQDYLKISSHPRLERKDLSSEIISDYAKYLEVKKNLKDSSHGKKMKHLRWFLKFIKFDSSQIKDIKIRTVKPGERNIIALTSEELTALETVDVSYDKELQRSKDMFLLGCYTGLRISDLKRISKHRIENKEIQMTLKKNRTAVSIPILKQTEHILERYDYNAPPISEQKVNEAIKKVCEKAGISKPTFFKSKKAGALIEIIYPKHKLITTHCAGKTFITLASERWDLTPADVSAIVGKDIKTILGYYLKPDQEAAKKKIIEAEHRSQMKVSA